MQKRAPTLGNIFVIILFALSCFGLLLFLWESFGGPLPLKTKGYRFTVVVPAHARALRTVGRAHQRGQRRPRGVAETEQARHHRRDHRSRQQVRADPRQHPRDPARQDAARRDLRAARTRRRRTGPFLPDNGHLADANVEPTVTLDDILAALDPQTRKYFQVWQQSVAVGDPRPRRTDQRRLRGARTVRRTHQPAAAASSPRQEGALREVVQEHGRRVRRARRAATTSSKADRHGEHTFHAAARGERSLRPGVPRTAALRAQLEVALQATDKFAAVANPYFEEFQETERQLSALLKAAEPFAPQFNNFLTSLGPLTKAAKVGLPQVKTTLDLTVPILENLRPVLHNFDPFLQFTGEYVPEVQAFFANITSRHPGEPEKRQPARTGVHKEPQAPLPDDDVGAEPRKPLGVSHESGNGSQQRLPAARHLPPAGQRAARLPGHQLLGRRAVGERSAERKHGDHRRTDRTDPAVQSRQHARKPPTTWRRRPASSRGQFSYNGQTSQYPHVVYSEK